MRTTIDRAGRIVVPKALREAAHLGPGAQVEIRLEHGRIEIEPVPLQVTLHKRGPFTVAGARRRVPPLTAEVVEDVFAGIRRGHGH